MSLLAMLALVLFLCALSMVVGFLLGVDRGRDEEKAMQSYRNHGDPEMAEVAAAGTWARPSRASWRRP